MYKLLRYQVSGLPFLPTPLFSFLSLPFFPFSFIFTWGIKTEEKLFIQIRNQYSYHILELWIWYSLKTTEGEPKNSAHMKEMMNMNQQKLGKIKINRSIWIM